MFVSIKTEKESKKIQIKTGSYPDKNSHQTRNKKEFSQPDRGHLWKAKFFSLKSGPTQLTTTHYFYSTLFWNFKPMPQARNGWTNEWTKRNQTGKEKAHLFYKRPLFADMIIYVKKSYEIYAQKTAWVSEFSEVARYKIKYRNKIYFYQRWKIRN